MAANIKTIINEDPSTEILGVSRDDLKSGDVVHCFSADSALDTGYSWTLVHAPDGSDCLLYTSPSPRDSRKSRMPSSA